MTKIKIYFILLVVLLNNVFVHCKTTDKKTLSKSTHCKNCDEPSLKQKFSVKIKNNTSKVKSKKINKDGLFKNNVENDEHDYNNQEGSGIDDASGDSSLRQDFVNGTGYNISIAPTAKKQSLTANDDFYNNNNNGDDRNQGYDADAHLYGMPNDQDNQNGNSYNPNSQNGNSYNPNNQNGNSYSQTNQNGFDIYGQPTTTNSQHNGDGQNPTTGNDQSNSLGAPVQPGGNGINQADNNGSPPDGPEPNDGNNMPPPVDLPFDLPPEDTLSAMDIVMKENHLLGERPPNDAPMMDFDGHSESIFEGDIVVTPNVVEIVDDMKKIVKDDMALNDAITSNRWAGGIIPYVFARSFNQAGRNMVYRAIKEYQKYTCVKFKPRTNERDYAMFYHGGGCSSMIGRQGRGRQLISLAAGCIRSLGVVIHEMMHCAGFFHEQSRQDRDNHIQINWNNIQTSMQYNFQKYRSGEASTLHQPYDADSVMHYGGYAFSKNGRPSIQSKRGKRLGQRAKMSTIDIKQLNIYYKCTNGGVPNMKDSYKFCPAIKNWCKGDEWPNENCRNTCCMDHYPESSCRGWKNKSYCTHNTYKDWMKDHCKKTCNKC